MKYKKRFTDHLNDAHDIVSTLLYDVECDEMFPVFYDLAQIKKVISHIVKAENILKKQVKTTGNKRSKYRIV